jgi:hypothetical protein
MLQKKIMTLSKKYKIDIIQINVSRRKTEQKKKEGKLWDINFH